jgi:hypothetical protein
MECQVAALVLRVWSRSNARSPWVIQVVVHGRVVRAHGGGAGVRPDEAEGGAFARDHDRPHALVAVQAQVGNCSRMRAVSDDRVGRGGT